MRTPVPIRTSAPAAKIPVLRDQSNRPISAPSPVLTKKVPIIEENKQRMIKDNVIGNIVERCFQYFDKNESRPIIKPHKEFYKQ